MKTRILMIVLAALALYSCQKNENEPAATQQEVTFSASLISPDELMKSTGDFVPCKNLSVDYAMVVLDDVYYFLDVFTIGDNLYTQAIKLTVPPGPPKTFTVSEFYLMHITGSKDPIPEGGDEWDGDDEIIWATPTETSEYRVYVSDPVDVTFTLDPFNKMEVPIDVLCFQETVVQQFGFFWFDITEIIIREQCFFGDFCIKHAEEYAGSSYANQSNYPGTGYYDAPAIVEIEVLKKDPVTELWNAVHGSPFTNNQSPWGVGAPVCIEYPDVVNQVDSFMINLKILVKVGSGFQFVTFKTWKFADGEMIVPPAPNGDGIVDFVLGNCNLTPTDLQLAPYLNLPPTATYKITKLNPPISYVEAELSDFGTGYDITTGLWPSWCADEANNIYIGTPYTMNVYSSLNLPNIPAYISGAFQWDKINWVMNHLYLFPGYAWDDFQAVLWKLQTPVMWNGLPQYGFPRAWADMPIAQNMLTQANLYGDGYVPLPGGWAAVIFASPTGQSIQTMFVIVDP